MKYENDNIRLHNRDCSDVIGNLIKTDVKVDLIITSPPYFNLEDYGNNECEKVDSLHGDYSDWLELYVKPLMINSSKYIKENCSVLINVKDFNGLPLETDFIRYGESAGLKYKGFTTLKNIKRINDSGFVDNSEKVLIFTK